MIFSLFALKLKRYTVYSIQFNFGIPLILNHTRYIYYYIYIFIYIYIIKILFRVFPCEKITVYCILDSMVGVVEQSVNHIDHVLFRWQIGKKKLVCPNLFSIFAAFFGRKVL